MGGTPARWDDSEPAESKFEQFHEAPLKRCQAKIVCLVLGSFDPNYRTKHMSLVYAKISDDFGRCFMCALRVSDKDSVP